MTILSVFPLLMGPLGLQELLVILLILVVIFGASKLPALGKGLGEGIKNFKKGIRAEEEAVRSEPQAQVDEQASRPTSPS